MEKALPGKQAEWLRRLDEIEALAGASRLSRLLSKPWAYLRATIYTHWIYPLRQKGWRRRAATFFGREMAVLLPAAQDIYLLGAKAHDSELRLSRFMIRHLSAGQTVVDVGAHYGFFSMLAAELVGPEGRVLALEASPATGAFLNSNLSSVPQAEVLLLAAGAEEQPLTFYEFPPLFSEYNSLNIDQFAGSKWIDRARPEAVTVSCRRLDTLLAERNLSPDFVKIDVEGAEAAVVEGLGQWLDQTPGPNIALEYLEPRRGNAPHRKAVALLQEKGYRLFRIDAGGNLQFCANPEAYLAGCGLESDNFIFSR